jgi:F-type H+-transporting ATPase subunit gamma
VPSTRDIRRRIKSVKNTAQITRAMQMVASAKMRRAQEAALHARPMAQQLFRSLTAALERLGEDSHPLMDRREGERTTALLITTDKGLCGPLNTNLLRKVAAELPKDTSFVTVGRKGRLQAARVGRPIVADFEVPETNIGGPVRQISKFLIDRFEKNETDRVVVCFTQFVNTITQEPMIRPLLPFDAHANAADIATRFGDQPQGLDYKFEPDVKSVLGTILPLAIGYFIRTVILDARASEHSARMVAMKNATDNAKQLVKDLTLEYNKVRQAAITTEILEIATAAAAMDN